MTPGVLVIKRGEDVETLYDANVQTLVTRFNALRAKPEGVTGAEILTRRGMVRTFSRKTASGVNPEAAKSPTQQREEAEAAKKPKAKSAN